MCCHLKERRLDELTLLPYSDGTLIALTMAGLVWKTRVVAWTCVAKLMSNAEAPTPHMNGIAVDVAAIEQRRWRFMVGPLRTARELDGPFERGASKCDCNWHPRPSQRNHENPCDTASIDRFQTSRHFPNGVRHLRKSPHNRFGIAGTDAGSECDRRPSGDFAILHGRITKRIASGHTGKMTATPEIAEDNSDFQDDEALEIRASTPNCDGSSTHGPTCPRRFSTRIVALVG